MTALVSPEFRSVCSQCQRPHLVCYCPHLQPIPTCTRVLILQHPRERRMPIGTARMAHLGLPNSRLRVGIDFQDDAVVQSLLAEGGAYVLFPGPGAVPLSSVPPSSLATLVVVDGTWWQAGKLLRSNPWLQALPRVALSPTAPSTYRIRRQPEAHCVSTIEALAHALGEIEPRADGYQPLLAPFAAMVDKQLTFIEGTGSVRHARPLRRVHKRRPPLRERLLALSDRLVFAQGEANAWPSRTPMRPEPELVHWTAVRFATGDRFEAVLAPRAPLSPSTSHHTGLSPTDLAGGEAAAAARARWAAFLRPDDVVATWGAYYLELARADGWALPTTLDVRTQLSQERRTRIGTIEDATAAMAPGDALGLGRGGRRLGALVSLVASL